MGDAVEFPQITDPYKGYASYRDWLVSLGAHVVSDPADLAKLANIQPTSSFTIGDGGSNYITMDGAGNMTVSGMVVIDPNVGAGLDGDFNTNKDSSGKTITYSGKGALYVSGDVQINTSLVTSGANSHPTNNIGIMTPNSMGFNEANIDVMGMFYAQDEIKIEKQTDIMGSIVSNYFDMGTNVPAIYQVPDNIDNIPTGMIGSGTYWYVVVVWMKT